jgi:hypothetical protein
VHKASLLPLVIKAYTFFKSACKIKWISPASTTVKGWQSHFGLFQLDSNGATFRLYQVQSYYSLNGFAFIPWMQPHSSLVLSNSSNFTKLKCAKKMRNGCRRKEFLKTYKFKFRMQECQAQYPILQNLKEILKWFWSHQ